MPNKPLPVIQWEQAVPRLCWTCTEFVQQDGHCLKNNASPPEKFQEALNACADWSDEVPF